MKLINLYKRIIAVHSAKIRMKLAIKIVSKLHKLRAKPYIGKDKDSARIRFYIVLLQKPVFNKRTGRASIKERLFYVDRNNFKAIRRAKWLPEDMDLAKLAQHAFYVSSVTRNYVKEQLTRETAINRYVKYIKKKYKP